jgi:phosphoketolase
MTTQTSRAMPRAVHGPLGQEELRKIDAYWRANLYLCVGMIYLRDNPLLRKPLDITHVKKRLLGHWGSAPGLVIEVIDRVAKLAVVGAHVKERMKGMIIANRAYAYAEGIDKPDFADWRWPERDPTA